MSRARPLSLALLISILAASSACTKSPPEPASVSASASASTHKPAAGSSSIALETSSAPHERATPVTAEQPARCIRPMPAEAPAPATRLPTTGGPCPADPGPLKMAKARVSFPDARSALPSIEVELATTSAETARGLMYRRFLPDDHGMLFDLHTRKVQAFWMRNTCIPLDMMFVDEDGTIVGILEQVPVLNEEERTVGCPSRYVLETNAGFARKHGIKAGQKVKLP